MGKIFISLNMVFLISIISGQSFGKCKESPSDPVYRARYFSKTKAFVEGKVVMVTPASPSPDANVNVQVQVLKVLKGKIKPIFIKGNYIWHQPYEGDRTYEVDKVYVLGIKSMNGDDAVIDTSACTPELTKEEIFRFEKDKHVTGK